ncbi:hypothetical protein [Prevotella sp. 10(H)]|uniref:hypothetical protein n=1 Tax=Prevotella sp. 10(H) TaxID=1158294 RepID=UPI0012DBE778|nr:hypothetical protein [Prevotella sp. 10(H)]
MNISLVLYSQEIYKTPSSRNELLFLGAKNSDGLLKVWDGEAVRYISKNSLEQTEQLSFEDTFQKFWDADMQIICSGYEPFWNLILKKDSVKGLIIDKEINTPVNYYYTKTTGWGWSLMFRSEDNTITGLVRRLMSDCNCEFEIENDISLFESFICIDGIVYEGCVSINRIIN